MKKTAMILALALAQVSAFAIVREGADQEYPVLQCSSVALRDAGLQVMITNGGLLPHFSAQVTETTIRGSSLILQVPQLTMSQQGQNTVYVDTATRGQRFTLVFDTSITNREAANATLDINAEIGEISQPLSCHLMFRPM